MLTVGELIRMSDLGTWSLTPGVGEQRPLSWAHVCELAEPWKWVSGGALLMTTGMAVPADPDEQCAFIDGMANGGIAAIAIGENSDTPPLSAAMLARAKERDFPVLLTGREIPFFTLAMAISQARSRERQERLRQTEQLYNALRTHLGTLAVDAFIADLSTLLRCTITIDPHEAQAPLLPRDRVTLRDDGSYRIPLIGLQQGVLVVCPERGGSPDFAVLQHAAASVGGMLEMRRAAHRERQLHGAILLGNLLDGALSSRSGTELVEGYGIAPPYALAMWRSAAGSEAIDRTAELLSAANIAALLTVQGEVLTLLGHADAAFESFVQDRAQHEGPIALSEPVPSSEQLAEAQRRTRLLLAETSTSQRALVRLSDRAKENPFLPPDRAARRALIHKTLGPLFQYDRDSHTDLVHTLHVFLAENKSWVRTSERLFLHRQTLVSRIARIEQISGYHVNQMNDTAVLWFALRCALEEGLLHPLPFSAELE